MANTLFQEPVPSASEFDLTSCDRCPAAAQVTVFLPSGNELVLCGHHYNANHDALREADAAPAIIQTESPWFQRDRELVAA